MFSKLVEMYILSILVFTFVCVVLLCCDESEYGAFDRVNPR